MACYKPIRAYQCADGSVVFQELRHKGGARVVRTLELACAQCIGCRLERSRQWAVRCLHESKCHELNCFVTLTYSDDKLLSSSLVYRDFQLFMKRLRKKFTDSRIRFYMSGEYGEVLLRPHFHAILFGVDFPDKKYWRLSPAGFRMYRSKILESLWPLGNAEIGGVTFESAAYIARYCVAKKTGKDGWRSYVDAETGEIRMAEFNRMSLKPGIGAMYMARFSDDVSRDGQIVVRGKECRMPKYYEKFMDEERLTEVQYLRTLKRDASEQTDERLAVREGVALARSKLSGRKL